MAIAILAAGKGKRMNNPDLPKVLFQLKGKPLLRYVLDTSIELQPGLIFIIIGYKKEIVIDYILKSFPTDNFQFVDQKEQLGTANAVFQLEGRIPSNINYLLILSGDVPLIKKETLAKFIENHIDGRYDLSLITTTVNDPAGYGRIIRDENGNIVQIVEHKDIPKNLYNINEINTGVYCVSLIGFFDALKKIQNNNAQNEYYLTDLVGIYIKNKKKVFAYKSSNSDEFVGVNTQEELKSLEHSISINSPIEND